MSSKVESGLRGLKMLDIPAVLFICLAALTVVVWTHSWICDRREQSQREELSPELQAETLLGVEEMAS